jgi:hypothetical protein
MHDLPDAYSKAVAAAVDKAKTGRLRALAEYNEKLDRIAEEFEADVVPAGVALDAGMEARLRNFRGEGPDWGKTNSGQEMTLQEQKDYVAAGGFGPVIEQAPLAEPDSPEPFQFYEATSDAPQLRKVVKRPDGYYAIEWDGELPPGPSPIPPLVDP